VAGAGRRFFVFRRKDVGAFAVLAEVESHTFFVLGDAQAHDGFQNEKDDGRSDHSKDHRRDHGNQLRLEERPVSEDQTVGARRIDCLGGETPVARAPRIPPTP